MGRTVTARRTRTACDRLIDECRARLWFKETAERLMRAAWPSALILLACALVHRFVAAVAVGIALVLCALPGIVVLIDGLTRRRPSRLRAAMAADELFGGKSLLTAAAEVAQRSDAPGACSALLLRRAEQAAANWRSQLRHTPALRPVPRTAGAPLVVVLACVFVLLLPGAPAVPGHLAAATAPAVDGSAPQPHDTAATPASTSAAPGRTVRSGAHASIRGATGTPEASFADPAEYRPDPPPAGAQPRPPVPAVQAAVPDRSAPALEEAHSPGSGTAARGRDAAGTARSLRGIRRVDIARSGDLPGHMTDGAQAPLAPSRLAMQEMGVPALIVTAPAAAGHQPAFSIAMRAYAARYFEILSGPHDE